MLVRSFTADSFDQFWQHWNPIFGYYLGRNVFAPLKNYLPGSIALILTFVFCGALHDAVAIAVRRDVAFMFTPWFWLMGAVVVLSKRFRWNYSLSHPRVRALTNLSIIALCFYLATFISV